MPKKSTPAEGKSSAKQEASGGRRPSACSPSSRMERIRRYYTVPAKRGMVIIYGTGPHATRCKIVGTTCSDRLLVRCERSNGEWGKNTITLHPTWQIKYAENATAQTPPDTGTQNL